MLPSAVAQYIHWLSWPLWGFIATIAQVLSLLALAFAIYELLSRSRSVPGAFILHQFGAIEGTDSVPPQHVIDVINMGNQVAIITEIQFVNATVHKDAERRVRYALQAGESMTLGLITESPSRVWVRIQWVSPIDRRYIYGVWRVLWAGTDLEAEWVNSNARTPTRHWWTAWFVTRSPRAIGPGMDVATRVRVSWNDARQRRRMARAFPPIVEFSEQWAIGSSQVLPDTMADPAAGTGRRS